MPAAEFGQAEGAAPQGLKQSTGCFNQPSPGHQYKIFYLNIPRLPHSPMHSNQAQNSGSKKPG